MDNYNSSEIKEASSHLVVIMFLTVVKDLWKPWEIKWQLFGATAFRNSISEFTTAIALFTEDYYHNCSRSTSPAANNLVFARWIRA